MAQWSGDVHPEAHSAELRHRVRRFPCLGSTYRGVPGTQSTANVQQALRSVASQNCAPDCAPWGAASGMCNKNKQAAVTWINCESHPVWLRALGADCEIATARDLFMWDAATQAFKSSVARSMKSTLVGLTHCHGTKLFTSLCAQQGSPALPAALCLSQPCFSMLSSWWDHSVSQHSTFCSSLPTGAGFCTALIYLNSPVEPWLTNLSSEQQHQGKDTHSQGWQTWAQSIISKGRTHGAMADKPELTASSPGEGRGAPRGVWTQDEIPALSLFQTNNLSCFKEVWYTKLWSVLKGPSPTSWVVSFSVSKHLLPSSQRNQ